MVEIEMENWLGLGTIPVFLQSKRSEMTNGPGNAEHANAKMQGQLLKVLTSKRRKLLSKGRLGLENCADTIEKHNVKSGSGKR